MKKFVIQVVFLLIVTFGALFLSFGSNLLPSLIPGEPQVAAQQIRVGETVIKIEVAESADERSKGLGGRDSLSSDSGMLFVFPEEKKYQFWMKGMKIPLDFIFIQNGKVVDILRRVPPPLPGQKDATLPIYQPTVSIDMMLEVNAGFAESRGIKTGDQVLLIP